MLVLKRKREEPKSYIWQAQGFGLNDDAPLGCEVTAASYLVRHSAIYANDNDYETFMEPFLQKLHESSAEQWSGPLSMLKSWKSPIDDPENQLENLTPDGAERAREVGKHLFRRYPKLIPTLRKIYFDKKPRTRDTARAFIQAFPQKDEIEGIEIRKTHEEFHAISPHKSCPNFVKSAGDDELEEFVHHYTRPIIARLQAHAGFNLTAHDIIGMQQFCGYESAITGGNSPLCGVFTPLEWLQYEYAWDLKYTYMVGHGNPLSPYLGFPWLNVTGNLFNKLHPPHAEGIADPKDDGQRFFVAFTHREVPPTLATALGLFNSSSSAGEEFPTDRVNFQRAWKMAELIPFLGHVGIELMTCGASSGAQHGNTYVRFMANSAPRPIPTCQNGPGASCAFHQYMGLVQRGLDEYGDFKGACGVEDMKEPIVWQ